MAQQLGLDLEQEAPRARRTSKPESFHVRSAMTPAEVLAGAIRNRGQEESILSWIRAQGPGRTFTPSEVNEAFPGLPITSIRRALTDLTTARRLVHDELVRRLGPRGAKESTWRLA